MAKKHVYRKVIFYGDYFEGLFLAQPENVKSKIIWTLQLIEEIERIPQNYLKKIRGYEGLYEIRINYASNSYRIFCCFNRDNAIVLLNGFKKKSRKTPQKEMQRAIRLMEEYQNEKR